MISKNSCKKMLKSTGLKVERVVVLRLQQHLNQISKDLVDKMKESTLLRGKKTIQLRDFEFVLNKGVQNVK